MLFLQLSSRWSECWSVFGVGFRVLRFRKFDQTLLWSKSCRSPDVVQNVQTFFSPRSPNVPLVFLFLSFCICFFLFLLFCTLSLRPGAALRDSLRIALLQNQWNQPNRRNRPWKKPVKRPQAQAVHTISWHHIDIHIALACITSHY